MNMRDLDELLPQVMPHAPSCPEPVALRYLRQAARDYCNALPIWRDVDSFTVADPAYECLCTLPDAEIVKIEAAQLDGQTLEPQTIAQLDERHAGWYATEELGPARYITQLGPGSVSLYPRAIGKLTMRLLLKPSTTARTIPEILLGDPAEVIGRGALGNILTMPNAEYANPTHGAVHLSYFKSETNVGAKLRTMSGQQGAPVRTKPRYL